MGEVLGDKMRRDKEKMLMDQEEIRKAQERLVEMERLQQERDDAERLAAEQRMVEQAAEEERRREEEADRERLMAEQVNALQAQIEQLQTARKEEDERQQREAQEEAIRAKQEEQRRLQEMEEQLNMERYVRSRGLGQRRRGGGGWVMHTANVHRGLQGTIPDSRRFCCDWTTRKKRRRVSAHAQNPDYRCLCCHFS